MVAAPEAGHGWLANGGMTHKVRVVVSMGCVNFEGAVKPGPASQRNFDLRWHCRPPSKDHSSQSLHISTGSIESTRWAAEVGGRRPSRAKADAGNSTTHTTGQRIIAAARHHAQIVRRIALHAEKTCRRRQSCRSRRRAVRPRPKRNCCRAADREKRGKCQITHQVNTLP